MQIKQFLNYRCFCCSLQTLFQKFAPLWTQYVRYMLQAKGIHKSYGKLHILKGVDLEVQKGEIITIVGASGAGKSTLLHIMGTLDRQDQGSIRLNNIDVGSLS